MWLWRRRSLLLHGGTLGVDAFAVDFVRFQQGVPFLNISERSRALSVGGGVVVGRRGDRVTGDPAFANLVEVRHAPGTLDPTRDFISRYLHLDGPLGTPRGLFVGPMAIVTTGTRLGTMDDTGNSAYNHLHFSIHDQALTPTRTHPFTGVTIGHSVRPLIMDGTPLWDGASGVCALSTNIERDPGIPVPPGCLALARTILGRLAP